ncbi:MAG: ABC transporter permease [Elusimicrobiota bacterium]
MNALETLRTGWIEILSHKTRSFLSLSSLAIGSCCILFTLSCVEGVKRDIREQIKLSGAGRLQIKSAGFYFSRGVSSGLTLSDESAIAGDFPRLRMIYPLITDYGGRFRYEDFHGSSFTIKATTPDWRKRDWVYRLRGRFINSDDVARAAHVCILIRPGEWVHEPWWARSFPKPIILGLLKKRDLLDRQVVLDGHEFTVVGILREPPIDKDPRWMNDLEVDDGVIIVPITTYEHLLSAKSEWFGTGRIDEIDVDAGSQRGAIALKRRLSALLASRHDGSRDYAISDMQENLQSEWNHYRTFLIVSGVLGFIAVFAGGIGIMNVTLAAVYSRIREIGIRRSVGATRADILAQFVVEALVLGFLGGAAGIGLGTAAILYLERNGFKEHIPLSLSPMTFVATALVAGGAAFVFSLYPASRAARLDPVEALRHE